MDVYSITNPLTFLEKRAQFVGLTLDAFRVPPINLICQKLQTPTLLMALNATPLPGFPNCHIGHLNKRLFA